MPRKSRPAVPSLVEFVATCIAALPFDYSADPTAPHLFPNLVAPDGADYSADDVRAGIAQQIAADRAAGLSGNDLRAKYSGIGCPPNRGLSGPMRRKVLRAYGHGAVVARSYVQYSDGEARKGTSHARTHGPHAAQRVAAAIEALANEAADNADPAAMRKYLRDADVRPIPRDAAKLRTAFVETFRASLLATQ